MFYYFQMAFKNIGRNRRRSILAIISVTISVAMILFMQGFLGGIMGSLVKNYTKSETGHIRISTKDFAAKYRFYPITSNIQNPQDIIRQINDDSKISPFIATITERINVGVMLNNNGKTKNAVALAGDVEKEKDLLMLQKAILPGGRYIQHEREILLGKGIATALGYKLGDTVKVVTQGSDFALHMRKFLIAGLFQTGMKALDDAIFQVSVQDARQLLKIGNATQQIIIMLHDYHNAELVTNMIRKKIQDSDLEITPWTQVGDYSKLITAQGKIYNLLYLIIAVLGAFIIGNIMMMVVLERRKEIGILKSLGVPNAEIVGLFLTEGAALGIIGSIAGCIIGGAIITVLHFNGIDITSLTGSFNFPIDNVITVSNAPGNFIRVLLIATIISSLMSTGPALKASKMNVVEAIKSV
jgi:putative ABC transport system permease protein